MRTEYRRLVPLLALAVGISEYSLAMGNDEIKVRKSRAQGTVIRGDVNPSSVPPFIRYEVFFSLYGIYRDAIIQKISSEDDEVLSTASASKMQWEMTEQSKRDKAWLDLCSNRDGKSTSALAREVDALDQAGYQRRADHWARVVDRLSPSGRTAVETFIDNEVARGISTEIPSVAELERLELSTFKSFIENECFKVLTGDYPEEMKQDMEEFNQLIEEKGLDAISVEEDK